MLETWLHHLFHQVEQPLFLNMSSVTVRKHCLVLSEQCDKMTLDHSLKKIFAGKSLATNTILPHPKAVSLQHLIFHKC